VNDTKGRLVIHERRPLIYVTLQNRVEKISRNLVSCEHLLTAAQPGGSALTSCDVTAKLANDVLTSWMWSDKPMIIWTSSARSPR